MFLHVGNGINIKEEKIIGIFDLDSATVSKVTKKFIAKKEKEKNVEYDDMDLPRSFVLYQKNDGVDAVRLSRISSAGLTSRAEDGELSEL